MAKPSLFALCLLLAAASLSAGESDDSDIKKTVLSLPDSVLGKAQDIQVPMPKPESANAVLGLEQLQALAGSAAFAYQQLGRPRWPWQSRWYCELGFQQNAGAVPVDIYYCLKPRGQVRDDAFRFQSAEVKMLGQAAGFPSATEAGRAMIGSDGGIRYLGRPGENPLGVPEEKLVGALLAYWTRPR